MRKRSKPTSEPHRIISLTEDDEYLVHISCMNHRRQDANVG
jgi:hypothetical protein